MRRPSGLVERRFVGAISPASRVQSKVPFGAPPPGATSSPTPQFRRHHDVEIPKVDQAAFRQGWRVRTRLNWLLETGKITDEAWDIARVWHRWCAVIGRVRVQEWTERVDVSLSGYDPHLSRVTAATKLREATGALGQRRILCLELTVLDDLAWAQVAYRLGVSEKTAMLRVAEALEALADWRAGRVIKPAPVERYRNEPRRL
jgi:DNA-directed RNA polymerase specialized sigma24 family protein